MDDNAIYGRERGVSAASTILTQTRLKVIFGVVGLCTVKRHKHRASMSRQLLG
jgi:hypothetical protein